MIQQEINSTISSFLAAIQYVQSDASNGDWKTLKSQQANADAISVSINAALEDVSKTKEAIKTITLQLKSMKMDHQYQSVFYDLLMFYIICNSSQETSDFLLSEEWEQIEEQLAELGSEFLNFAIYLHEAKIEGIEPEINDFLDEFLLAEEDEFQDEHEIYLELIVNRDAVDMEDNELTELLLSISEESPMEHLISAAFAFFRNPKSEKEAVDFVINNGELRKALPFLSTFYSIYK